MQLTLIKKGDKDWTRIKVGNKELLSLPPKIIIAFGKAVKISSKFNYYEVEGDLLNRPKPRNGDDDD